MHTSCLFAFREGAHYEFLPWAPQTLLAGLLIREVPPYMYMLCCHCFVSRVSLLQLACPDAVFLLDPIQLQYCAIDEFKCFIEELFGSDKVLKLGEKNELLQIFF